MGVYGSKNLPRLPKILAWAKYYAMIETRSSS